MEPNENSQTVVDSQAFGRKGQSHAIKLQMPISNSEDKLVFSPRPMKRNFLNNKYATLAIDQS